MNAGRCDYGGNVLFFVFFPEKRGKKWERRTAFLKTIRCVQKDRKILRLSFTISYIIFTQRGVSFYNLTHIRISAVLTDVYT